MDRRILTSSIQHDFCYRSLLFGGRNTPLERESATLALILGSVGLPLDAIGLILAVDRILDMIRTSVNVCGDAAVSCIVAKSESELEEKTFNKLG